MREEKKFGGWINGVVCGRISVTRVNKNLSSRDPCPTSRRHGLVTTPSVTLTQPVPAPQTPMPSDDVFSRGLLRATRVFQSPWTPVFKSRTRFSSAISLSPSDFFISDLLNTFFACTFCAVLKCQKFCKIPPSLLLTKDARLRSNLNFQIIFLFKAIGLMLHFYWYNFKYFLMKTN